MLKVKFIKNKTGNIKEIGYKMGKLYCIESITSKGIKKVYGINKKDARLKLSKS